MKATKESVTITMSRDEAAELLMHVGKAHDHLETYFADRDVESGTPESKLADAMTRLYDFWRTLRDASYA